MPEPRIIPPVIDLAAALLASLKAAKARRVDSRATSLAEEQDEDEWCWIACPHPEGHRSQGSGVIDDA